MYKPDLGENGKPVHAVSQEAAAAVLDFMSRRTDEAVSMIHRIIGDTGEAADAWQSTLEIGLRSHDRARADRKALGEPFKFDEYMLVTARNEARGVLRKLRSRRNILDRSQQIYLHSPSPLGPEEAVILEEDRAEANVVFGELLPRQQAVLRGTVMNPDVDYAKLAAEIGMPVGSIGPTRARGLRNFRSAYLNRSGEPAAVQNFGRKRLA